MCDTMISIADDGILFAKNSDRDPNEAQLLEWHPAAEHADGDYVAVTWTTIPQARNTHAIVISRPWWMWGAEMGTNEFAVTIGNQAVFTKSMRLGPPGLLGMDLVRLGLERARTADEATETIVNLLETYGQNGSCSYEQPDFTYHNSFVIADREHAVILETAGRRWAREPVRGRARSISNGLTIPGFAEKHADRLRGRVAQCARRRAITEAASKQAASASDMMAILRDNGTGGAPRWSLLNGSMTGPNMHAGGLLASSQTVASWVSDLSDVPRHFVTATADPALSVFKPVAVTGPLTIGATPTTNRYDYGIWWRHERFRRYALRDWATAESLIRDERDATERAWLDDPPAVAQAFAHSAALTDDWLTRCRAAGLRESRPRWLRRRWARYDAAAHIEEAGRDNVGASEVPDGR